MKLLALDTSASACSVALLIDDDIKVMHEIIPMQQAQLVLPMIDELLSRNNIKASELSAWAFGCGPGSFTGVRIATSVIQGLAFGTCLPVISISSLAAAAQTAFAQHQWRKIHVAMDARMHEVYCATYLVNANGLVELQGKETLCHPQAMPVPVGEDWYGIGNGWKVYENALPYRPIAVDENILPSAFGVSLLAKDKFLHQDWLSPEQAIPVYLRDNVAEKGR